MGPLVATGSSQRAAAFCPGLGGSKRVCVCPCTQGMVTQQSKSPGAGGAVNPGLTLQHKSGGKCLKTWLFYLWHSLGFGQCQPGWTVGAARVTARITFPFPDLWWETHQARVYQHLLPPFPDPF